MPKIGVILSGCGNRDGSEIHEAVCTLLALAKNDVETFIFAPNIPQADVINFLEGSQLVGESRNVLVESARIARGKIKDITHAKVSDLDGIIFPGGSGVIKNLCTFAEDAGKAKINQHVSDLIVNFHKSGKPIGALCIAPVLIALALGRQGVKAAVTIGTDTNVASQIESLGFMHVQCSANDCIVDQENKIVTTPCYMLAQSVDEIYRGISRLVEEVLRLI
jgi:enhancing lycopene biosynthesis protein 2